MPLEVRLQNGFSDRNNIKKETVYKNAGQKNSALHRLSKNSVYRKLKR